MAESAGGEPRLPEDLVLWEILTRLPSKPLLRCRAVCRSWRYILTSDATFLLAHHRRQPALQLVTIGDARECRLDALDHRAGERRPVARMDQAPYRDNFRPLAACDGLLIVSAYGSRHICNPATRQRASLPRLSGVYVSGLYPHRPSGSYRVLCWKAPNDADHGSAVYYVYTVGFDELRCVGESPGEWATRDISPMFEYCYPPVLVHGRFHWRPVGGSPGNNMLAFDTVAESFRRVRTPVEGPHADPFEMKGELGLYSYNINGGTADLWVLEDYDANFWSFKYSIKLERPILFPVPDEQGDVFIVSQQCLEHLSSGGSSVATRHEWNILHNLMRHRLKETLVRHDFFPAEGNGGADETMLFRGLSTAVVLPYDNSKQD
uniref:Uncharacterized protein n=1 Tax=Avena sativa TaxID=4498 RepID=A0ACD5YDY4_AVESA